MEQKQSALHVPKADFSVLAIELKIKIFEYVPSKWEQANMRLVCRVSYIGTLSN